MPSKKCLTCGEEFDVIPSRDDAKFCSRMCYHTGQKEGKTSHPERYVEYEEVECDGCGKLVEKPPSRVDRSSRQFCSESCYHDYNKAHQKDKSGKRQRRRERKKTSCEICGFDRFIEMAHIVPSRDGGTYHKNNILFLCPNHHRLLDHGGINKDELLMVQEKLKRAIVDGDGWRTVSDE